MSCRRSVRADQTNLQPVPELLPQDEEVAMALGAAPEHLRVGASVYVLQKTGFAFVRQAPTVSHCIVNRDSPLNRKAHMLLTPKVRRLFCLRF